MSNAAMRKRRTVPLDFSSHKSKQKGEVGEHSIHTGDSSLRSSSLSAGMSASSTSASRTSNRNGEVSISTRRLEPIRNSFLNSTRSGHSKESASTTPNSISTAELKRSMSAKRKSQRNPSTESSGPKTPSGQLNLFTIGSETSPMIFSPPSFSPLHDSTASSRLTDGVTSISSLEEALQQSGLGLSWSESKRASSSAKSPFASRTPFEVDAPRDSSLRKLPNRSLSSALSVASEPANPLLSDEQDAWAGIDALLETKSMDDSFTFSTSDILPRATVKAMRRQTPKGSDIESVWGESVWEEEEDEKSEAGESRMSKRSLESISKTSSASSNSSRLKGRSNARRSKVSQEFEDAGKAIGKVRALRKSGSNIGEPGLFDVFQWSEKDNIDEQRRRKGKLNSNGKGRTLRFDTPDRLSNHGSDSASLPSLASIRRDDCSVRSGAQSLDWDTYHSHDMGSVVSEETSRDEFGFEIVNDGPGHDQIEAHPVLEESSESESISTSIHSRRSSQLAGDGLVLDKGVDEYIRQIQRKLPTIIEDDSGASKKGKKKKLIGFVLEEEETSPSPISVIPEETAFDELPSLTTSSGLPMGSSPIVNGKISRMEEKKEQPKPSLTYLMSSIKRIASKSNKARKKLGDEEKYFPDAKASKSKKYSANRCLLSEGDDGVNWDTD